jgi:hypothetical protein
MFRKLSSNVYKQIIRIRIEIIRVLVKIGIRNWIK